MKAIIDGVQVFMVNDKLMKMYNISYQECHSVGTIVHMAIDGKYAGHIADWRYVEASCQRGN